MTFIYFLCFEDLLIPTVQTKHLINDNEERGGVYDNTLPIYLKKINFDEKDEKFRHYLSKKYKTRINKFIEILYSGSIGDK